MLWRLYDWLRRRDFRRLKKTPRDGEPGPLWELHRIDELERLLHPPVDTGGTDRPTFRSQFDDPTEGHSSPHSEGSNCTCAAAAMALDFHTSGRIKKWGGDMRHTCPDQEGGTDLGDMQEAWGDFGETLDIRSGDGWGAVMDALRGGRGVMLQGMSDLCGCSHCIYVHPEQVDGKWVVGDPIKSGWTKVSESDLRRGAEELWSGIYFAVTAPRGESEAVSMGVSFEMNAWEDPGIPFFRDSTLRTQDGTTQPGGIIVTMGAILDDSDDGVNYDVQAALINQTIVGGAQRNTVVYVRRADLPDSAKITVPLWDTEAWSRLLTPIYETPPPDPEPEPVPDPVWYQSVADKTHDMLIEPREWTAIVFEGEDRWPFPDTAHYTLHVYSDLDGIDARPSYAKLRVRRYLADGTEDPTGESTFAIPANLNLWSAVLTSFGRWDPTEQMGFDIYHDGGVPITLGVHIEKSWNGEPAPI